MRLEGAVFYSDVRDLIQTVVLPDTTTQTQNVGDGEFYGAEVGVDAPVGSAAERRRQLHRHQADDRRRAASRTCGRPACRRTRRSCTRPGGRSSGSRSRRASTSPAIGGATSTRRRRSRTCGPAPTRWSTWRREYAIARDVDVVFGFKNLTDDNYELAWGFPQPGRTFYVKTRIGL